jgi:hypothetical protein
MSPMLPLPIKRRIAPPPTPSSSPGAKLARVLGLMAGLALLAPAVGHADPLPQCYRSDTLPQLPPSQPAPGTPGPDAPVTQPASDIPPPAPAPAPAPVAAPAPPPAADPAGDPSQDDYVDTDPSALTDFQDALSPYGSWVDDPTYGTVWVPNPDIVGADFAPYQTAGNWALDDSGDWMWASDYEWGYVPFHYGRWVWGSGRWGWIAGRQYAPAWVAWRVGDAGYLGWAPLPPAYYWRGGVAYGLGRVPPAAFAFCPSAYAFNRNVGSYVVHDRGMVRTAAANTRPFKAASPSVGGGSGSLGSSHFPASPSMRAAGIPASAVPKTRTPADPRARGFATHSSTAAMRASTSSPGARSLHSSPGFSGRGSGLHAGGGRGQEAPGWSRGPVMRTPRESTWSGRSSSSYRSSSPAYHGGGGFHAPAAAAHPRPTQSYSAPHPSGGGFHGGGGRHR